MNQEQEQEKSGFWAKLADRAWNFNLGPPVAIGLFAWLLFSNSELREENAELREAAQLAEADKRDKEVKPYTAFAFLARSYKQGDRRIEFELASFAAEAGMNAEAEEVYEKIIAEQPDDPIGYYRFALFLKKQGKLRKATEMLDQAISSAQGPNARRAKLLWDLGAKAGIYKVPVGFTELLKDLGVSQMPEPLVAKALELPLLPTVDEMQAERAWLLFRQGNASGSQKIFRDLADQHPDNPRYRGALGYQLAYEGSDLDEAVRLLEEAAKGAPNDPNILTALGWVQYSQGWLPEASVHLGKALRSEQGQEQYEYVRTLAHYGEILWEEGKQEEAVKVWREGWCEDDGHDVLQKTLLRRNIKFEEGNLHYRQSPRGAVICRVLDRLE